ncbi:endogenous retrovirus group K member 21 Pro protein-like [Orycteropus afer afer]|uniref:Endogenous retrovirus group K member 21 Pro protein-like n=1 Tax=Orycteropus afer afer TaxID=1230840 RepID=A0AC54ZDK2_ORYAF|nr:endogenous retrovirus group K member 21 Pro protein-like [Orycteropus afer afer]
MVSLKEGTISLQPKVPIAQLILIPRYETKNMSIKPRRGDSGFGSTDTFWMKIISLDKPMLQLNIMGKNFLGLIDTGADVSVMSQAQWPTNWPLQDTQIPIKGVGQQAEAPHISSNYLVWTTDDGLSGTFQPFILDIEINLWDRDILTDMGLTLQTSPISRSQQSAVVMNMMTAMGYVTGKGLGKNLEGNPSPLSVVPKKDKTGLGFSLGH